MALVAHYTMSVGEQRSISYSATKSDNSQFDATGYTVRFRMKRSSAPGPPYDLDKQVNVTTQLGVIGSIDLATGDTLAFVPDVYYFDVTAINGTIQVPLTTGTFELTDRVSR